MSYASSTKGVPKEPRSSFLLKELRVELHKAEQIMQWSASFVL